MVVFRVVPGKKGAKDKVVLVWAYGEPLNFADLLFLLKTYFESESSYYPVSEGYQGKCMLIKAILEVYSGIPLERVCKFYKLKPKAKIIEEIGKKAQFQTNKELQVWELM